MTNIERIKSMDESELASFLSWVSEYNGDPSVNTFGDAVYTASCRMCPKRQECLEDEGIDCLLETSWEEDIRRWLKTKIKGVDNV